MWELWHQIAIRSNTLPRMWYTHGQEKSAKAVPQLRHPGRTAGPDLLDV